MDSLVAVKIWDQVLKILQKVDNLVGDTIEDEEKEEKEIQIKESRKGRPVLFLWSIQLFNCKIRVSCSSIEDSWL